MVGWWCGGGGGGGGGAASDWDGRHIDVANARRRLPTSTPCKLQFVKRVHCRRFEFKYFLS